MSKIDNSECRVRRTTFICWPWILRSGYRVSSGTQLTRWYRYRNVGCRFFSAILQCAEHTVEISEHAHSENKLQVVHEVRVNGLSRWLLESYDRRMWSAPSYRVLDLDGGEILTFPKENWKLYNIFGHVLPCSPNDRGEIRIFEHGGVAGHGWPVELLIGIDLFKEAEESG